jgi:alkylhydroperoxidase family enzyme
MTPDALVPMLSPEEAAHAAERVGLPAFLAKLNIFRVLLRRGRFAKGFSDALGYLLSGKALDARLRELAIMRIAWRTGSDYEWTQHWAIARQIGVCEEDLLAVRDGVDSERFDKAERAVMEAVDVAVAGGAIPREVLAALKQHMSDDAVLELVATVAGWAMVSVLLRSLEVPLEEGLDGWPPDGVSPSDTTVSGP